MAYCSWKQIAFDGSGARFSKHLELKILVSSIKNCMELTKFVDFGSFVKRSPDVSKAKAFYRNESTYQIVREEE